MRKVMRAIAGGTAALAIAGGTAAVILTTPVAQGSPTPAGCTKDRGTISCIPPPQTDKPHNNWTLEETTTVKGNFNSSHDPLETGTATNPGGFQPPGQQP